MLLINVKTDIVLEWTTSLDTSSRTLFVCRGGTVSSGIYRPPFCAVGTNVRRWLSYSHWSMIQYVAIDIYQVLIPLKYKFFYQLNVDIIDHVEYRQFTLCEIFYFSWHRYQIEVPGPTGVSYERHWQSR